jgi:hypothetical protein
LKIRLKKNKVVRGGGIVTHQTRNIKTEVLLPDSRIFAAFTGRFLNATPEELGLTTDH